MKNRILNFRHGAFILFAFVFVMLSGINHGIWRPDEPYVAGICSAMSHTRDFVVPMLNGKAFLEKPPLYYAVAGVSGAIFGPTDDVSFRLASILFAALTIMAVFFFQRRRVGIQSALITCLVLATIWGFFTISRWILVDIALVFGVSLSMLSWMNLSEGIKPKTSAMICGLGMAIAFLSKGLVGPALIVAGATADIIRRRDIKLIWRSRPDIMIIFMLAPVALWGTALWERGGWPFVREVLVVNNLMRFTGAPEGAALGHQHGVLFYFDGFFTTLMPWTLIFIPAFALAVKRFRQEPALSWVIGPFILLSIASTKRDLYLAPLLPACAMMISAWLSQPEKQKWELLMVRITWGIIIAGAVAPLAGIFLGVPFIGVIAGFLAISALTLIDNDRDLRRTDLALALSLCISMSASMMVYYAYTKPKEDYLTLTRQALELAGKDEIRIIGDEEILEGVVPMLTGKLVENIPADQIKLKGKYLWVEDKKEKIIKQLQQQCRYSLLLDRPVDHKRRFRLAELDPNNSIRLTRTTDSINIK